MKGQIEKLVLIGIAIILVTVGCGPTVAQASPTNAMPTPLPPTPAPPAATTAPSFPIGSFYKGGWKWEFRVDGSYDSVSDQAKEHGIYNVYGNQISIMGDYSTCLGIVGIYTWTFDGSMLILTTVDDKCTERQDVASGKWRYEP